MRIRCATAEEVDAVQKIANQNSKMVGFVMKAALHEAVKREELSIALINEQIVGFAHWHKRRDGWVTLYEIASLKPNGAGAGLALLHSLPVPLRLKCTVDNPANDWYKSAGMKLVRTEAGRKRALNVYERTLNWRAIA